MVHFFSRFSSSSNMYEKLYSPSKMADTRQHHKMTNRNNNYSTDKKRSKLNSNLAARLVHIIFGKEK